MFGGFYIVPLYALIQTRCPPSHRSRVIAANNILNALFMVVAAGLAVAALKAGVTIARLPNLGHLAHEEAPGLFADLIAAQAVPA